jgi:dihydroneopterin aldolase
MIELFIKDLIVEGKHGVHEHEKINPQRFKISVRLYLKETQPNISDELEDTVNWSAARKQIINVVETNSFNLMERLAQEIADKLLEDKRIERLTVVIDKIDAFSSKTDSLSGDIPGVKLVVEAKQ